MDHRLNDVTVAQFRRDMLLATHAAYVVTPVELREPLSLWFAATEERARVETWDSLLGRPVIAVWNAAQAVLNEAAQNGHDVTA